MLRSGTCGADRGFGSLVQQCWLFGAAAAVIVPCSAYTASKQGIASKHQDRAGLLSRAWLFFSVCVSCVSLVCGLSGSVVGNNLGCGLCDCKSHVAVGLAAQGT